MRHPVGVLIAVACCVVPGVMPGCAAGPYDGTWSGTYTGSGACAGTVVTLTVTDGVVSGGVQGPMANGTYLPTRIDPDGTALFVTIYGNRIVKFTADNFEMHINGACGHFDITGNRTSH